MVAWIALILSIVAVLAWVFFIIGIRSIVNRYKPTVAPYLAMFAPPAAAGQAKRRAEYDEQMSRKFPNATTPTSSSPEID